MFSLQARIEELEDELEQERNARAKVLILGINLAFLKGQLPNAQISKMHLESIPRFKIQNQELNRINNNAFSHLALLIDSNSF